MPSLNATREADLSAPMLVTVSVRTVVVRSGIASFLESIRQRKPLETLGLDTLVTLQRSNRALSEIHN